MKILWCGALYVLCVFLSSGTCSAGVHRPNRASGSNEGDKIVAEAPAGNGEDLIGWKILSSASLESGQKTVRRNPRCYDESEEGTSQEVVTVKYLPAKWPAWAGTLYHHRILHPYHDWNNTGITGDPWNHETHF